MTDTENVTEGGIAAGFDMVLQQVVLLFGEMIK